MIKEDTPALASASPGMFTYVHAHEHAHVHVHAHTDTHKHTRAHTCEYAYKHKYIPHTYTQIKELVSLIVVYYEQIDTFTVFL